MPPFDFIQTELWSYGNKEYCADLDVDTVDMVWTISMVYTFDIVNTVDTV